MSNTRPAVDTARSAAAVKGMLRDIGYVLWLSRMVAAEVKGEKSHPARPEMSEFCAVDASAFAAWFLACSRSFFMLASSRCCSAIRAAWS